MHEFMNQIHENENEDGNKIQTVGNIDITTIGTVLYGQKQSTLT